jgi:iron complex transport system substrate-binding protein
MTSPRVISLIASSTEMVCALDCGAWLVGRSHECDHPEWVRRLPQVTRPKFALDGGSYAIDERVRALVEQGVSVYEVDADALVELRPDVILTQTQCEVCAVSETDVLEATRSLLPEARVVSLHPGTLDDIWRDIMKVAGVLGVPERGVQEVAQLRQRMHGIGTRASAFETRTRVACVDWIDPLMRAGHWTPELIELAGGVDALAGASNGTPLIEWHALTDADPDTIIVAPCGFTIARALEEMPLLEARPEWNALRAVREGRVFVGDGNAYFNRPGPRVAETLETIAELLHPDAFRFGHEGSGWVRCGPKQH